MLKTKKKIKRSSPPQIVEFECISDQNIILTTEERIAVSVNYLLTVVLG